MDDKIPKGDPVEGKLFVPSTKILKREVYESARDARDVISIAQEKAKQIIQDAQRERDAVLEQGREEGYAKGLADWNQILAETARRAEELSKGWEDGMLRLSIRVAEKIVGEELKCNPDAMVAIVREALRGFRPGKHITIQVNSAEADRVRARLDALRSAVSASSEIDVVDSPSVTPGGCVIESELGIIDARLETQLKCLEEALVRGSSVA